ncbi:MAG TPA: TonB-dependent receptor plug domain-containing protein, partial [Acidobacteriota bacterium]|nr:TonB-dependent receptor plug domain-containing protein [Acidobacteriota bacterium]
MKTAILLLLPGLMMTGLAAARQDQAAGSDTGVVKGKVILSQNARPIRGAEVFVIELNKSAYTDEDGLYEISGLSPGTYDLVAHIGPVSSQLKTVRIQSGQPATVDFELTLTGTKDEITVTGKGREESTFHSIQSVSAMDFLDLVEKAHVSIGEVLDREPGVAKRSWGPGSSRPVIRGFDGDRVLILNNGLSTGSLSSQSGDHGETLDVLTLDRVEVVRGPAALLYGSNAIGGVVNAIKRHHQVHEHPHEGLRGYLTALGGSANGQAGTAAGGEYGLGEWLFWGQGSAQRSGDYSSPLGKVPNSRSRSSSVGGGVGRYTEKFSLSLDYEHNDRRYGIPFAAEFHGHGGEEDGLHEAQKVDLALQQHTIRFDAAVKEVSRLADRFQLSIAYGDYAHQEVEVNEGVEEIGTSFENRLFTFRGVFDQKPRGALSGSFGVSGALRDYRASGEEAVSPPVDESNLALFAMEELDFDALRLQFGGRVERRSYDPVELKDRSFTVFSGAAGIHIPLW